MALLLDTTLNYDPIKILLCCLLWHTKPNLFSQNFRHHDVREPFTHAQKTLWLNCFLVILRKNFKRKWCMPNCGEKDSFKNCQKATYKVSVCDQESAWKREVNKYENFKKCNLKIVFHRLMLKRCGILLLRKTGSKTSYLKNSYSRWN